MYIILKLVCEWAAENHKIKLLHPLFTGHPRLGRKTLKRDAWCRMIQGYFTTVKKDEYGATVWRLNGLKHRFDGPAFICKSQSWLRPAEAWYLYGQPHRDDGPAELFISFTYTGTAYSKVWKINGVCHREDGPAIERTGCFQTLPIKEWRQNGVLHRVDGPAVIYSDGGEKWFMNGNYVK